MNKMLLVSALSVLVSGCTTVPQAPKDAKEMAEMGDDSFLNVPVDVSNFSWKKMDIVAKNGDKGRITVFTDQRTGKTYDLDGQPLNEKGERILKDGYVCEVSFITSGARGYISHNLFWGDDQVHSCYSSISNQRNNIKKASLASGLLLGPAGFLGAAALNTVGSALHGIVADDTL